MCESCNFSQKLCNIFAHCTSYFCIVKFIVSTQGGLIGEFVHSECPLRFNTRRAAYGVIKAYSLV